MNRVASNHLEPLRLSGMRGKLVCLAVSEAGVRGAFTPPSHRPLQGGMEHGLMVYYAIPLCPTPGPSMLHAEA
jgi:hypothetical protein